MTDMTVTIKMTLPADILNGPHSGYPPGTHENEVPNVKYNLNLVKLEALVNKGKLTAAVLKDARMELHEALMTVMAFKEAFETL